MSVQAVAIAWDGPRGSSRVLLEFQSRKGRRGQRPLGLTPSPETDRNAVLTGQYLLVGFAIPNRDLEEENQESKSRNFTSSRPCLPR